MYKLQENFADNLTAELDKRCMTMTAFGHMTGQTVQTVSNYCNKISGASIKRIEEWSAVLGQDPYEMLADKKDRKALKIGRKCLQTGTMTDLVDLCGMLSEEERLNLIESLKGMVGPLLE